MSTRGVAFGTLAVLLVALASAQEVPRPADPLTAAEREKAVRLASEEALRRQMLQRGKFSLVGVELVVLKDRDAKAEPQPDAALRHASVLFYRYDRGDGLQALVDVRGGRVRDLIAVNGQSVPIGREETERAVALALRDEKVTGLLGPAAASFRVGIAQSDEENTIEALRVVAADPHDPCLRQRCIDLFFRSGGYYVAGSRVTVNLTSNTVRVTSTKH